MSRRSVPGPATRRAAMVLAAGVLALSMTVHAGFVVRFVHPEKKRVALIELRRAPRAPRIDGRLDDESWKGRLLAENLTRDGGKPGENRTRLFATYDEQRLYIAADCSVKDMSKLRRDHPAGRRDARIWSDDCIDFKLAPAQGGDVYQFIINVNGARYDAANGHAEWNPEWRFAVMRRGDGYTVEVALPLASIGARDAGPGAAFRFSFNRADCASGKRRLLALAEPYGKLDAAPIVILGTTAQYKATLASVPLTRKVSLSAYLDRWEYPSFQKLATGRVRLASAKDGKPLKGRPAVELSVLRDGRPLVTKRLCPVEALALDFDLDLGDLGPGSYALRAAVYDGAERLAAVERPWVVKAARAQRSGRVPITVAATVADLPAWPITFGAPFPRGAVDSEERVKLLDAAGNETPIQTRVACRWSKGGSLRWLLIDFAPPVGRREARYALVYGPDLRRKAHRLPDLAAEADGAILLTAAGRRLRFPTRRGAGLAQAWVDADGDGRFSEGEKVLAADDLFGPYMVREDGKRFWGALDRNARVVIEENGPIKACVRVSGWHVARDGKKLGKFILRYVARRGCPHVRLTHTFTITEDSHQVRYRDIGYSIPIPSTAYEFGLPETAAGKVGAEGAYLLQRDDEVCKVYEGGRLKRRGGKADGWVAVAGPGRGLTLTVRDFWQQYPKELEVTPRSVTAHFWPAHGEDPIHTGKNLSIRNVYRLWFAHEGRVLNFKVPEEARELLKRDSRRSNYPRSKFDNAIGLAKSHEMLLHFHAADARSADASRVFQDRPVAVCAPEWMVATKVFGETYPRDPKRFPKVERALDEAIARILCRQAEDHDYGMFNFGDAHHNWKFRERRWSLHRLWRQTHHGWTRWPWMMYARSGSKAVLDYADRQARHVADVDHCHYTTRKFTRLRWPRQKLVGGIRDYKGMTHWSAGGRLGYNSIADSMLWHYYVTGNRRSLETAMEHGAALLEDGRAGDGRFGSARVTSACALYRRTWDNGYLEFLERTMAKMLDTREGGVFPGWANFAPFLQRYVALTGSPRGREAMLRWADARPGVNNYRAEINVFAHAFLYSGDERYLRVAATRTAAFVDHVYRGKPRRHNGLFLLGPQTLPESYFMQYMPSYLAAAARLGRRPEPLPPPPGARSQGYQKTVFEGRKRYAFRAWLRQDKDRAFDLAVYVPGLSRKKFRWTVVLEPTDGGKPLRKDFSARGTGDQAGGIRSARLRLPVPLDGALEYRLGVYCDIGFAVHVPISQGQDDLKEVYAASASRQLISNGRFYFRVPEGAEAMALRYRCTGGGAPTRVTVLDSAGRVVAEDFWMGPEPTRRAAKFPVKGAGGAVWSFRVVGGERIDPSPPVLTPPRTGYTLYYATSPDKLFVPAPK